LLNFHFAGNGGDTSISSGLMATWSRHFEKTNWTDSKDDEKSGLSWFPYNLTVSVQTLRWPLVSSFSITIGTPQTLRWPLVSSFSITIGTPQ